MNGQPSAKPGYRPDVEGLRAVAVLAVVLFHADVPGVGGGYIGVDVFFVISGFLITGLLWREMRTTGSVGLRRFYGARARRLLPASAAVGVVTAICSAALLPPLQARSVFLDGIASALYVSNYRFVLDGVDYLAPYMPPSPFLHYWSLGVEEQFYLVWPALIIGAAWIISRTRRGIKAGHNRSERPYIVIFALVAVGSFALSLAATRVLPSIAFFSLPTRAWQLAVGGLVALTATQWHRLSPRFAVIAGWAGLGMVLLGCTLLRETTPYPGTAALLPTVGTALIIGAGCVAHGKGCGRVLSLSPMRAIGRVSYSWYLWHWPVLLLAPPLLDRPLGLTGRLIAALISLVLAVLTLHLIENPLRFSAGIRRSPARSLALGAAATAVAVSVCVALLIVVPVPVGRGAPAAPLVINAAQPPPQGDIRAYESAVEDVFAQVQAAVAASAGKTAVPRNLRPPLADATAQVKILLQEGCMRNIFQIEQPECAAGDVTSATTVALVGDSNATMWSPALEQAAEERHWRLELLTKAGCPLMDVPITHPNLRRVYTECEQWRDGIVARLRAERPQLVVLGMKRHYNAEAFGFTSYDSAWHDGLTRMVRQLRELGSQVMVLGPIPDPQAVASICLSGHLDDANACSPQRSTAVNESGIAAESAATAAGGGQYVDLTDLFCTAQLCPVIVGNTLVYLDQRHITIDYGRQLAPVMSALVERELARR
nr:acyltransferase family protein [Mycobacterium sp. 852014-52144_SCH5372336]